MKLLLAADIFPPQSGGPATYVVTLANELMRQGVEVHIVSLNPLSDQSAVTCLLKKVKSKNKLLRYAEYVRLLCSQARDCDVVYAMGPVNAGLSALIAARWRKKKFVAKVVGDYAWEQGVQRYGVSDLVDEFQKNKYGWQVQLLKRVESFVVRQADLVITPCQYLKNLVVGWGADTKNVKVVYNAMSSRKIELKQKSSSEKWIVSVGRLVPWKGMDTLVAIMPDLKNYFPTVKLKIIGDGPESGNLKLKIKAEKVDDCVELLGNLSHEETLRYIDTADVFVLNSGYEGLSHVLLEALVSPEVEIIASNVGGNPELIQKGINGFLFSYNKREEIVSLLKKILERSLFVYKEQHGIKFRVRDWPLHRPFLPETMINNTRQLLESICQA